MCGRARLSAVERFKERFNVENDIELAPRYNIAPGQKIAVVRQDRERPVRTASFLRWGLIPHWAKDEKAGYKMINARSETVMERPAFRECFERRRCLIPADGFYEWQRNGATKQPFHFGMADDSVFGFAGLWDRWRSPDGEVIESCSVLTTVPNSLLKDVHDRMPVILRDDDYDVWLDPGNRHANALTELLRPFDSTLMRRYPVSTRVNFVAYDDAQCAEESTITAAATASTPLLFD